MSCKTRNSRGLALGAIALIASSGAAMADFAYPDFASVAGLNLMPVALQTGNTISITPPTRGAAGAVWRTQKEEIQGGFSTDFTFRITDVVGAGADGFAFVIQNSAVNAIGGTGGALGYATNLIYPDQQGISNCIAIEFDTWNNQVQWADFNSDLHISVQHTTSGPASPAATESMAATVAGDASGMPNWADGNVHHARVIYDNAVLELYLDNMVDALISVPIDLSETLELSNGFSWVGFTAATGGQANVERHELLSWSWDSNVPTPGAASLLAMGGLALIRRRAR